MALACILLGVAMGSEYGCDACQSESGWSGQAKLDEIGNPNASSSTSQILPGLSTVQKSRVAKWNQPLHGFDQVQNNTTQANVTQAEGIIPKNATKIKGVDDNGTIIRSAGAKSMLAPIEDVSSGVILLDISENASEHIPGSISIPYTDFLNDTNVRTEREVAGILGDAGISTNDSVVLYGECMPCGGGPAPATFVYWIMKSLGHENVRVLDGSIGDWAAAGGSVTNDTAIMPSKIYASRINAEYTATYDYVKSGKAQIVDARTMQEFGAGSIPGSINIPNESVINQSRIKDERKLQRIFAILDRNRPVVVYTNTGVKASVVWFALKLLGYDARLYAYNDWVYRQEANAAAA